MKSLSKFAVIFPFVCLLALAAVIISTAFPSAGTALADDAAFDIVYPEKGYFPIEDATLVAASDSHIAVFDAAARSVFTLTVDRTKAEAFPLTAGEDVTGLWLSSSTLLVQTTDNASLTRYYAADLTSAAPELAEVTLDAPADISYITADDDFFYAKSDTEVAQYSNDLTADGLTLEKLVDDKYINGKYIFTARDGMLYFYAQDYDKSQFFVYDIAEEAIVTLRPDTAYIPAAVSFSDYGITAAQKGSTVRLLSAADGAGILCDTGIAYDDGTDFTSYGDKIYVTADGALNIYTVSRTTSGEGDVYGVTLTETLAMRGSGEGFFDDPSDILVTAAGTFVADAGNSRIVRLSSEGTEVIALGFAPVALAADSSGVIHVASESTVYTLTVSGGEWTARPYSSVPTGERVADIAYAGSELVILTDSALYARSFLDASPARVSDIDGGIALATARGDVLYILTETGIHTLSAANGTPVELIPFRAHDFSGATDVAADYAGTLFVSYGETGVIAAFDNALSAVTQKTTFTLTHPLAQARPVAFALSGSRALFLSSTCFVGSVEVGAVDSESYIPVPEPDTDAAESLAFAVLSADGHIFVEPSRFDTMSPVSAGTVVLCYDGISSWDGYTYVYTGGRLGYVETSSLTPVAPSADGTAHTLHAGSALYKHPAGDAIMVENDIILTVTDDAAALDGGVWVRVSYGGGIYFASASDLTPYTPPVPEREEKFGRASADRPGGLIGIYSLPDVSSATVTRAVDGTRMEIVGEEGDFWMVSFDGVTGYALKSEVELEGLTTVQIVSIVLCCAVAVTGVVVFVILWQARKKEKEKE